MSERIVILQFVAEFTVPCVLAMIVPSRLRLTTLLLVGVVAFIAVCYFAYRANLVENGGDLSSGVDGVMVVAVLNAIHFVPLWALGGLVGWQLGGRYSEKSGPLTR